MKKSRNRLTPLFLTISLFLGGAPAYSQGLKDAQKDALREALNTDASSHYQSPPDYSNPGGYYPYAPPPRGIDPTARNQHAYDVGYRVGQDDFHAGQGKRFARHRDLFDEATHDSFGRGYEIGYDRARSDAARRSARQQPRAHTGHVESSRYPSGYYPYSSTPKEASPQVQRHHGYETGFRVGQDDFRGGHAKHYSHHAKLYSKETQHDFALGYERGYDKARARSRSGQASEQGAVRVSVGQGRVSILKGNQVVSTIRTAAPNVEQYHFTNGVLQIVVKSRGNHGPATVELFDTKTGTLRGKVLAFAIRNGQPSWAKGMAE